MTRVRLGIAAKATVLALLVASGAGAAMGAGPESAPPPFTEFVADEPEHRVPGLGPIRGEGTSIGLEDASPLTPNPAPACGRLAPLLGRLALASGEPRASSGFLERVFAARGQPE